jgi:glutathione S-transferase
MVYDRWMLAENWPGTKQLMFGAIPAAVRPLVAIFARRGVRQELVGQGIGRHSSDEIHRIGIRDLNAVADFLGDKPFFMGPNPTEIDATVYGLISNIIQVPVETPVKAAGLERPNLLKYCDRMKARFF